MDNEVYRDISHAEACEMVARFAERSGHVAWREVRLPNRRIADVLIQTGSGNLEIVEVKLEWKDSLASEAHSKYWHYCHRLWIAVPGLEIVPGEVGPWPNRWRSNSDKLGIIGVNRDCIRWLRQAEPHAMPAQYQAEMLRNLANPSRLVS